MFPSFVSTFMFILSDIGNFLHDISLHSPSRSWFSSSGLCLLCFFRAAEELINWDRGKYLKAQRQRENRERQANFSHWQQKASCSACFRGVACLSACACTWPQISEFETCFGLSADCKGCSLTRLRCDANGAFQLCASCSDPRILHVASAVSGLYDIYFVLGRVNQCNSLKAEHLCHGGVIA